MFHDDLDFIIFVIYWNIWFGYMEPTSIEDANELHHISIKELIAEALDLNKVYNCPEGPDVSRGNVTEILLLDPELFGTTMSATRSEKGQGLATGIVK
ncbi:hypothetical protein DTO027B5_3965 [Paecilomyces variotii]|nr:hypothetical protein DTO195F2_1512 [Paecilomyces variotii]KAJ9321429.1 hypothetical protein DTO027B3_7588 [Paecilomyces variotii]KAJ9334257.1 hypothetical protein DTO027B5_3965 [Paecilomyces variotii]KAJ9371741.1 hypothetical protein DTO282E5_3674 [Paecilomyces variotii]